MEGDLFAGFYKISSYIFQSTPSAWRETITMPIDFKKFNISIHSLRMEGDDYHGKGVNDSHISIHSLRMEGD